MALSGTAPAGTNVQVYLDDASIGTGTADAAGRWQVSPSEDVPPGRYRLRADAVDASGRTRGRVQLPLERAGPRADLPPGELARSEEHTSELQSLMRISYAVFCLKKKQPKQPRQQNTQTNT